MFDRLLKWSMNVLVCLASVALTVMILVVVVDVAGREFFDAPLTGAYELVEFCMGVLCPVSVVYCIYNNEDICVDLLYLRLGKTARKTLMLIANAFVAVTSAALLWQSFPLVRDILGMGTQTALLGIAMWPIAVLVLLSYLVMLPIQLRYLLRSSRTVEEEEQGRVKKL